MGPCSPGVCKQAPKRNLLSASAQPGTRNHFHIFKWLKKIFLKNNISQFMKIIQISVSINEALLGHSHAPSFYAVHLRGRGQGP